MCVCVENGFEFSTQIAQNRLDGLLLYSSTSHYDDRKYLAVNIGHVNGERLTYSQVTRKINNNSKANDQLNFEFT